jgi:hypothetical protein
MHFQCCFCGNGIIAELGDPLALKLCVHGDEEQELFCHLRCLQRVLHASVPLLVGLPEKDD